MTRIITRDRAVVALCLVAMATGIVHAQPQPGDIYKEFWWDSLAIVREQGQKCLVRRLSEYWSPQNYMKPYDVTVDDLDMVSVLRISTGMISFPTASISPPPVTGWWPNGCMRTWRRCVAKRLRSMQDSGEGYAVWMSRS